MHPTNRFQIWRAGLLAMLGLTAFTAAVLAQEPPPPRPADADVLRSTTGAIIVPVGVSQTMRMATKKKIATVQLDRDGIVRAGANAVDETTIVLTGLSPGTVRITLIDVDGKRETYDVIVQLDVAYIKKIIADAVPSASVNVTPVLNRAIMLTGWVAKAEDVDTILRVASVALTGQGTQVINALQVGGVQQVQLDVTVARVNRTEARRRGFAWAINGTTVSTGSLLGGLAASSQQQTGNAAAGGVGLIPGAAQFLPNVGGSATNLVFGVVPWNFQGLMQALRDEQLAKLLAEPKLVTLSGRPAHFLSGGQQAVLSAQGGLGGPGVNFRDIGTELSFLPVVLGNGRIYLEVNPVVRSVNQTRGITTAFGFVPGFDEQSVRTALELEPGQTMAIGGLIQTTTQAAASRVPVLGDLPFIGGLFSTNFHEESEEETIILVTPHLVDAMDCRQAPKKLPGRETRSPDDYELFLEYLLEAPRGQRQVFENGLYKAPYKNSALAKQYPCADPLPKGENRFGAGRLGQRLGDNCSTCAPGGTTPANAARVAAPGADILPLPAGNPAPEALPDPLPQTPVGGLIELPKPPAGSMSDPLPAPEAKRETKAARSPNTGPVIPKPQFD